MGGKNRFEGRLDDRLIKLCGVDDGEIWVWGQSKSAESKLTG